MKDKVERTREEIIAELTRTDESFYRNNPRGLTSLLREGHTGYEEMTNKELAAIYWRRKRTSFPKHREVVVIGADLNYLDLTERELKGTVESYFARAREYEKGKSWFREMNESHRLLDILLYLKGVRNSQG